MLSNDNQQLLFGGKDEKVEEKPATWLDHQPACATCGAVDIARPATLALACAIGAPLLAEHLVKVSKPAKRVKEETIRKWAEKAGTFKTRRGNREAVKLATKHKK